MKKKYAIGIDIGGSHISSVLVEIQSGQIVRKSYSESKLDNQASAEEIFQIWGNTIQETINHAELSEIEGLGFAMPGPFDYENGIALFKGVAKYDNLYGLNVKNELNKVLNLSNDMPFRYINDAMSFAIGEAWSGPAAKYNKVVAVTLGTGFGSAFIKDGVPVIEGNNVPPMGYVYNIPYENGIADDYFSTRWFINEYEIRSGKKCKGVKEIAEQAAIEQTANELFVDFGRRLGRFLEPLLNQFDAQCLVIGGNISKAYGLFGPLFQKELNNASVKVEVVISELMEDAAMTGSARLMDSRFWAETQQIVSKI
tara:strand:+ start:18779 stop:19714 length:936 start_codon:yes stop_codon:yes gene_type:complete